MPKYRIDAFWRLELARLAYGSTCALPAAQLAMIIDEQHKAGVF